MATAGDIHITKVSTRKDLHQFVDLPYRLYRGNPYWAPPLRRSELDTFSPQKNPAYEHCQSRLFLAKHQGRVVGRIAGIINEKENELNEKQACRFGWIDFEDDLAISASLLGSVEQWAVDMGCDHLKGPYGFSNMDKAGLLIEGFEELSTMAVIYNYPYYSDHLMAHGFEKLVDWKEFETRAPTVMPDRLIKFAAMIKKRYRLTEYQPKDKEDMRRVGRKIFELINITYRDLEGFIPHSDKQIELFVSQYLGYVNPEFVSIILDEQEELAGFGISMPSFTKALQKANGRLFPFGVWHLRKAMRQNDRMDLYLIAIRPDLQNKGITAIIFKRIIETAIRFGIRYAETNPELEDNQDVQNLWKGYHMRLHKRRRSYIKQLSLS